MYLHFLNFVKDKAIKYARQFRYSKDSEYHLLLVAIYGSIIELITCCIILINDKPATGVPILLRSILEAYADFINLCADPSYVKYMRASELQQWLWALSAGGANQNPYLSKIFESDKFDDILESCQKELSDLQRKKYLALKPFERFGKANMEQEYGSIYNDLCCYTHNNIRALKDWHFDIEKGKIVSVSYFKDIPPSDMINYVDTMCSILINSSCQIHDFLNSPARPAIKKLKDKWLSQRKQLIEDAC